MTLDPEFWQDRFHFCALYAAKIAFAEGKLEESEYVRRLTYRLYEEAIGGGICGTEARRRIGK